MRPPSAGEAKWKDPREIGVAMGTRREKPHTPTPPRNWSYREEQDLPDPLSPPGSDPVQQLKIPLLFAIAVLALALTVLLTVLVLVLIFG